MRICEGHHADSALRQLGLEGNSPPWMRCSLGMISWGPTEQEQRGKKEGRGEWESSNAHRLDLDAGGEGGRQSPSIPSVSTLALPRYRDVMYIKTNGKATVGDNFPPPSHLVSRRLKQVYNNMLTTYRAIRELGSGNNAALQLPMLTR